MAILVFSQKSYKSCKKKMQKKKSKCMIFLFLKTLRKLRKVVRRRAPLHDGEPVTLRNSRGWMVVVVAGETVGDGVAGCQMLCSNCMVVVQGGKCEVVSVGGAGCRVCSSGCPDGGCFCS